MPTTTAIASELRRIADLLDKMPDVEVAKPHLSFFHGYSGDKNQFVALAKVFPRPLKKGDGYAHDEITLTHKTDVLDVYASIEREKVCTLVEPARAAQYACIPLLSLEEEAALDTFF